MKKFIFYNDDKVLVLTTNYGDKFSIRIPSSNDFFLNYSFFEKLTNSERLVLINSKNIQKVKCSSINGRLIKEQDKQFSETYSCYLSYEEFSEAFRIIQLYSNQDCEVLNLETLINMDESIIVKPDMKPALYSLQKKLTYEEY